MEAGEVDGRALDLIDVMIDSADTSVPDYAVGLLEAKGCPTCGSCSGMFTANSMNSLTEALGLSAARKRYCCGNAQRARRVVCQSRPSDCCQCRSILF